MTYQLDGGFYDRGGRLEIDKYLIDRPDDVADPLKDYQAGFGGGMRSIRRRRKMRSTRSLWG
jgi:hypothetical protein